MAAVTGTTTIISRAVGISVVRVGHQHVYRIETDGEFNRNANREVETSGDQGVSLNVLIQRSNIYRCNSY